MINFNKPIISEFEQKVLDFLQYDMEDYELKNSLYYILGWTDVVCHISDEDRIVARNKKISEFFTFGIGKKYYQNLPEHIKNKVLAYSV